MMSTHIMQEVEAICDRVIIINNGKIVADDTASNIKSKQKQTTIINVEFSGEVEISEIKNIKGIDKVESKGENNYQIFSKSNSDVRPLLFKFAVEKSVEVLTLQKEEQSMEQIFKDFTSK